MRVSMTMLVVAALSVSTAWPAVAQRDRVAAPDLYPEVGAGTNFLNHAELLGDVPEPAWYEANIPFVDLPDREIRDTYYYRWRTYREALKYTGPKDGWIVSEFLGPVGYSAPNGGIVAAAGHHIYEGRWLRDHRYLDDYVDYWLRGSGSVFDPADYATVVWDDTYETDRLVSYRRDGPFAEPPPSLKVANGVLTASATSRSGVVLAAPVTGDARGTAVVVEPRSFAGSAPEDSLFLGQTAGNRDFALAWFNNAGKASGVDVTVAGVRRGDEATGGCCASLTWAPGDRLAVVVEDGRLTSWIEHEKRWTLLRSAPIGFVVDPSVVAGWAPALGLRLDTGTLVIDRFTVRSRTSR